MKKVSKKKKKKIDNSYVIKDKYLGNIVIKHTANAWWKSEVKVNQLLTGYKMGCTSGERLLLAGITKTQFQYFKEEHIGFCDRLEGLKQVPNAHARALVVKAIQTGDIATARWYLERKLPQEFKERKDVTSDDKLILIEDVM